MQPDGSEMGTCGKICLIRSEDLPRDPNSTEPWEHSIPGLTGQNGTYSLEREERVMILFSAVTFSKIK